MPKVLCFICVCLVGLFIGAAFGVQWGTAGAGGLATGTFAVAWVMAAREMYK